MRLMKTSNYLAVLSYLLSIDSISSQAVQCIPRYASIYNTDPLVTTAVYRRTVQTFDIQTMWNLPETTALVFSFRLTFTHTTSGIRFLEWGPGSNSWYIVGAGLTRGWLIFRVSPQSSTTKLIKFELQGGQLVNRHYYCDYLIVQFKSSSRVLIYVNGILYLDTAANAIAQITTNNMKFSIGSQHYETYFTDFEIFNVVVTPDTMCTPCVGSIQGVSTSSAMNRVNTGVRGDLIFNALNSTGLAVSARIQLQSTSTLRTFMDFGSSGTGNLWGVGASRNDVRVLYTKTSENVDMVYPAKPSTLAFHTGQWIDFLWVLEKDPIFAPDDRILYVWMNGQLQFQSNYHYYSLTWPVDGTQMSLNFLNVMSLSNVEIYDQPVSPWSKCRSCASGEFGAKCKICDVGKFAVPGDQICSFCPAGTYRTSSQPSTSCASCPQYSNSIEGSSAITNCRCDDGYHGPDGGICTAPQKCAAGSIGPPGGPCVLCVTGKYKNNTGN